MIIYVGKPAIDWKETISGWKAFFEIPIKTLIKLAKCHALQYRTDGLKAERQPHILLGDTFEIIDEWSNYPDRFNPNHISYIRALIPWIGDDREGVLITDGLISDIATMLRGDDEENKRVLGSLVCTKSELIAFLSKHHGKRCYIGG